MSERKCVRKVRNSLFSSFIFQTSSHTLRLSLSSSASLRNLPNVEPYPQDLSSHTLETFFVHLPNVEPYPLRLQASSFIFFVHLPNVEPYPQDLHGKTNKINHTGGANGILGYKKYRIMTSGILTTHLRPHLVHSAS